jgi:hypothetical protein
MFLEVQLPDESTKMNSGRKKTNSIARKGHVKNRENSYFVQGVHTFFFFTLRAFAALFLLRTTNNFGILSHPTCCHEGTTAPQQAENDVCVLKSRGNDGAATSRKRRVRTNKK